MTALWIVLAVVGFCVLSALNDMYCAWLDDIFRPKYEKMERDHREKMRKMIDDSFIDEERKIELKKQYGII